jgi:dTDP-4-amino-4,6-dideoxygalactose transaminase
VDWRVPLADLDYGVEEQQAVLDVLRRRWLTMGSVTQDFECQFAEFLGVKYAIAVSNATMALHLACRVLGLGPGDEVIVPSLTFVATANAALYTGAEVRFADILGPTELNLSPSSIEKAITPKTKAIIIMHYGGYPCRLEAIQEIAKRHNLYVIEDAAHAPGASVNDRALGTWGELGCFSFFSNKNLSTGEGGMLVTDQEDLAQKIHNLRSHGMTSLTWDRHRGHAYSYDVVDLGYNYRIDEMRSALGIVQLNKLKSNNQKRKYITERYWGLLEGTGVTLPFKGLEGSSAHHIFPILLPDEVDRKAFIDDLRDEGIQTSIHYPPVHQFSYYRQRYPGISLPETEAVARREVTLPLYPEMRDEDIEQVVSAVRKAISYNSS